MTCVTDVDLTKFMGLRAYADLPVAHDDVHVYLDSVSAVMETLRSRMSMLGMDFDTLADESGVPVDSLARLRDTGVTRVRDALAVFRCLGLRVSALPAEYAGTVV